MLDITRPDARVAALGGLIDYAGLFPPAGLGMADAVAEYRAARIGADAWIVERFLCPVGRLEELAAALVPTMAPGEAPWCLSAIGGGTNLDGDIAAIRAFDAELNGGAAVELVETKVPQGELADWAARAVRMLDRMVFFEIPWAGDLAGSFDALVAARETTGRMLGAKLRTGGPAAADFPSPAVVAEFLIGCRDRSLPMKATAGLHHPVRHIDSTTGFTHHGFLNLLAGAALAVRGEDAASITAVVADDARGAFEFDRNGIRWRGLTAGVSDLQAARRGLFVAYGSCSFDEPVEDLTALGVLPVAS
jgi:hypothetical protein